MFNIKITKKHYKILFYITAIAVFIFAVVPNDHLNNYLDNADKWKHFTAFFTLSYLLNRASSTLTHRIRNMIALLVFGIFIEFVQIYLIYRTSSIYDIYADMVGILLFQVLLSLWRFIAKID
jgi:VanZ family protein